MTTKIDISIIILSFNTRELLKKCLVSVKNTFKKGFEIETIVVDNASSDGSQEMLQREFPWVFVVESSKNLGYAGGNNLGIRKAKGKYILFLNSDVEIEKEALVEVKRFMDSDAKIGAFTPKVTLFSGKMDPDCHRGFPTPWASITYFSGLEKLFPKSRIFGKYHMGYEDFDKTHEIDAGFGTFMVVKKEVIDKVGVWDDSYFFYGEDLDYFYRIKRAGWKVMFFPVSLALHHKGASSGLRRESKNVTNAGRTIKIKTAKASIDAMERFYKKFYKGKYDPMITFFVIFGIKILGFFRVLKFSLLN